jgi:CHASE2 domain-containing sensor protein
LGLSSKLRGRNFPCLQANSIENLRINGYFTERTGLKMASSLLQLSLWSLGALLLAIGFIEARRKNAIVAVPCLLIGSCSFVLGCLILSN